MEVLGWHGYLDEVLLSVGLVLVEVVDFEGNPDPSTVDNSVQPSKLSLKQQIPMTSAKPWYHSVLIRGAGVSIISKN